MKAEFLHHLLPMWRAWQDSPDHHSLDKWLSNYWKQGAIVAKKRGKDPLSVKVRLALGDSMLQAQRYLQLAAALEESFRTQTILDWAEWDAKWSQAKSKLPPEDVFWFWVLCLTDVELAKEWRLEKRDERLMWYETLAKHFEESSDLSAALIRAGLRPSWAPLLQQRVDESGWTHEQLLTFISMQTVRPPVWLRTKTNDIEALMQSLKKEMLRVDLVDGRLCVQGGAYIAKTDAYTNGLIEIQDYASQQIAETIVVKSGDKVWDACAGAGGKSLAIAQQLNNTGGVTATDLHQYKLDELKRRAKRSELFNIRSFVWDGKNPLALPQDIRKNKGFDWVLIDAPCTSAGTWRRNPDARWRFNPTDTQELVTLQRQLLRNASEAVKLGGHLVYATCSWQVAENEDQIRWFTTIFTGFELVSQQMLGAPTQNCDTMFVAVLKRVNG